jgi:hypothetical protein
MATQGQQGRGSGKEQQGGRSDSDLKEREYRDKEGNIHHHTHAYMEQHKGEGQSGGGESERAGGRQSGERQHGGSGHGSKSEGGKSEGRKSQGGSGKGGKQ